MNRALDFSLSDSPVEFLCEFETSGISLAVKREDKLHPEVSGNKFRKLKYNLQAAKEQGKQRLLTFGGAYSNHISAVAAAGEALDFETIGVIRGEELALDLKKTISENPTLKYAAERGMRLFFINRSEYGEKEGLAFQAKLKEKFGDFYLLPEGGTNELAIHGCKEILGNKEKDFDFLCCPVGTGGTIAGIINSSFDDQMVLGFPALKGDFLFEEISKYTGRKNWKLIREYHFGGYGKISSELVRFMNDFHEKYQVLLDPVYTGKMFYGIFDMIEKGRFPENSRILAVHTGGLQGISGMNQRLAKKNFPLINI